jgi:hypothetical protein
MELQRVAEIVSESRAVIGSDPVHAAAIQAAGKGEKMLTQAGNAMTIAAIVAFCIFARKSSSAGNRSPTLYGLPCSVVY